VVATYSGRRPVGTARLFERLYVTATHNVTYSPDVGLNCAKPMPKRPLEEPQALNYKNVKVSGGAVLKGHLCIQVSKDDAADLVLYVNPPGCNTSLTRDTCARHLWFALRNA
jgi:hypothetical protein